mgnify:CR=1 FL=1
MQALRFGSSLCRPAAVPPKFSSPAPPRRACHDAELPPTTASTTREAGGDGPERGTVDRAVPHEVRRKEVARGRIAAERRPHIGAVGGTDSHET